MKENAYFPLSVSRQAAFAEVLIRHLLWEEGYMYST